VPAGDARARGVGARVIRYVLTTWIPSPLVSNDWMWLCSSGVVRRMVTENDIVRSCPQSRSANAGRTCGPSCVAVKVGDDETPL
jgi:hypothetical protein